MTTKKFLSNPYSKEIDDYIDSKPQLSESSKTTYINSYGNVREVFKIPNDRRFKVASLKVKDIIKTLEEQQKFNKLDLLKIIILIKDFRKKSTKQLNTYRFKLFEEKKKQSKTKMKEYLTDGLTYEKLIEILNTAKEQKNYQDYILFYLLIFVNVRNLDLIIINKQNMSLTELKKKFNIKIFNYIQKKNNTSYEYVRNIFKTKSKYGIKTNLIEDEFFIESIKNIKDDEYIFTNRNNKPYEQNEINKFIIATFRKYNKDITNINQQIIYQIILKYYEDLNDNEKVKEMRNNRGHQAEIQEHYYSSKD